jgi:hypothetical protein
MLHVSSEGMYVLTATANETLKISQMAEKWNVLLVEKVTVTFDMETALCE